MPTAGAPRSPPPLAAVLSGGPHPLGQVPVVQDIVQAVVQAVARERQRLAAQHPQWPRGRPRTKVATQAARPQKRLAAPRAAVFASRSLVVQRPLTKTARKTLWRVSRGLPQLQARRAIMAQVDAWFDRRCRTQTALAKRATLRRRVQRFKGLGDTRKQLFAPTLEKALTWLDDT